MRTIGDVERRTRLARRHRLAPEYRAPDVIAATEAMVCLHGTDPATVYLSAWARVHDMRVSDLEHALYTDRSLVKQLAMRRTLFIFPRETLPSAQSAAGDRVAAAEWKRLVRDVEKAGLHRNGDRWLRGATDQVLATLSDGREATSSELRNEIPALVGSIEYGQGKSWGAAAPVGPRVLTVLSAAGQIVRASNDGGWTTSRPRWATTKAWLGEAITAPSAADGTAAMVERWLRAFGPGTVADIKWWLGSTVSAVRQALTDVAAVEVDLDGQSGFVLPDDVDPDEEIAPWAALLPPLDPTTMGWFQRDWYLGSYKDQLFDTTGNAGPTAWWDGRIVGGWRQTDSGEVVLQLLEDIGGEGQAALDERAAQLTEWVGGTRLLPRFPSPLSKTLA